MPQTKHVNTTHKQYPSLPKASKTYRNIIKSFLPSPKQPKVKKDQLPTVTYGVDSLKIDRKNLNEYRKICGFIDECHVPVTYFAVLSQSLQMNMMVEEPFPFAMLGLVHIANSVTQYRPISQNEIFSLSVKLDNLRDHDKGQQFDFVTTVKVKDELVWEGVSTYLSRSKQTNKKPTEKKAPTPKLTSDNALIQTTFYAPEDIGLRYAMISGDFNLIHIHPMSARAFGFRKAIAHGMWSKATCLAKIKNLPDAYSVDVAFKLPIFLPSEVEVIVKETENAIDNNEILQIGLYSYGEKDDKPHLTGVIKKLG